MKKITKSSPSKPKKNTKKEIKAWAIVAKDDGEIMMWRAPYANQSSLAIFDKRTEIPAAMSETEFKVKRCRIILD